MNRNHSEVSEQQEMKGASFIEAERNPEKEEQRGKALGAQQDMKKLSEQETKTEKKQIDTKETKEEKREKNIDSSQELYAENSKGEGQKTSDTTETTPKKTRLEDLSWQDIHQMQKEDPEKLQAMNKDYQERFSAEALGMNVEEYRAHMDRIAKANESDETQENTLTEDWRSQMEADLFQNQNLNFEEEQVDEKKDSVQEKSEKPENTSENPQENLEDKEIQESTFTIEDGKIEPETQTPIESESHFEKEMTETQEMKDEQRYANLNETQDLFADDSNVDEYSKTEERKSENQDLNLKERELVGNKDSLQTQHEKSENSVEDLQEYTSHNEMQEKTAYSVGTTDLKLEDSTTQEIDVDKSEVSNETYENLSAFEQNNWNNLSQMEKEQAIEKLRNSIAEDFQLENKPDIVYYNNEEPGDYGGYAASTNTIYINCFNIDDAIGTADTIAHESRHCWQHERADNPRTEQDYQFKENFENYVRPELNFELYQAQLVEQDACDYAEQVKDLIPQDEIKQNSISEGSVEEKNEHRTENLRAPPEDVCKSVIVTEVPVDFEEKSVTEVEMVKKVAYSIRGADDFRSHMSLVYKDEERTTQEKFEYGKKLYDEIPQGQRKNINVIDNFKAIRTDKESLGKGTQGGYLPIAFHDHHGLDETKPINGIENGQSLPAVLCRRGGETGNNLTELHEDGSVPTIDEISVPYIENPEAIHVYKTDVESYKKAIDIISGIDNSNVSEKTQDMNTLIEKMNEKYDLANEFITEDDLLDFNKSYSNFQNCKDTEQCNCNSKYGVCGSVAPMYVNDDQRCEKLYNGGASQYNTPCSISTFISIGVFREE